MSSRPLRRQVAGLSLDLDNLWSYMRIHGDAGWESFPSYLDVVVPRVLDFLDRRGMTITVFIVGKDAEQPVNAEALRSIAEAGHEIGNHSHMHEPWLHLYEGPQLDAEIATAHDAIASATGVEPVGFRGPGFSVTPSVIQSLHRAGYAYDSSTLPTWIGPLARWYYFRGAELEGAEAERRAALFGSVKDGLLPNRPYRWGASDAEVTEIPVTTFPYLKVPIHFSYLLYLSGISDRLARGYYASALRVCQWSGTGPTMLLHPLDFMDGSDAPELSFFPAMDIHHEVKIERLSAYIDRLSERFEVGTVRDSAAAASRRGLRLRAAAS